MATTRTTKKSRKLEELSTPLIFEPYPETYVGLPFITYIQYRTTDMLVIVDNVDEEHIKVYDLEACEANKIDQDLIMKIALEWYGSGNPQKPISVEFSSRGLSPVVTHIYKTLKREFISRFIGPAWQFSMYEVKSIKRRRRRPLTGLEISPKSLT